jgi:anti-sigma factor RsiW
MSNSPLTEQQRADLVAYLDGELTGEAARAPERTLSLNEAARAEAESLRRTWNLLDFLPRPSPSADFTEKTISRLMPVHKGATTPDAGLETNWRLIGGLVGWAAALFIAVLLGHRSYLRLTSRGPGEKELIRDLRVIENKRFYDLVDDLDFLRQLDQPDLFGEESSGP